MFMVKQHSLYLIYAPFVRFGGHISSKYYGWGHKKIYRTGFRAVAIPVPDSLSHRYLCTFCLVLYLLKLSLFMNVISCLVPKSGIYFWYRSNDMSSETQGDGGRGLGRQLLNHFINHINILPNIC